MKAWKDVIIGIFLIMIVLLFSAAFIALIWLTCKKAGLVTEDFLVIPGLSTMVLLAIDVFLVIFIMRKMFGLDNN